MLFGRHRTPVVLISYNRHRPMRQVISGLRLQRPPLEIIVHDNGSNDVETLEYLNVLVDEGVAVFRYPPITDANQLNEVNSTVERIFTKR